jgi:hypothetical protein
MSGLWHRELTMQPLLTMLECGLMMLGAIAFGAVLALAYQHGRRR